MAIAGIVVGLSSFLVGLGISHGEAEIFGGPIGAILGAIVGVIIENRKRKNGVAH